MRTIKLFLILSVMSVWSITGWAQNGDSGKPVLFVEKTDGSIKEIPFADSEIVLLNGLINVKTPIENIQFDYDEVSNFYFALKSETSIEKMASPKIKVFPDNTGNLHISGDKPLGHISIYSVAGQLLKRLDTDATEISVNISAFPKGLYLVKTEEGIVKIVK